MRSHLLKVLSLFSLMSLTSLADSDPLEPFQWENRLILAKVPEGQVNEVVANLKEARAAIKERHILWFVFGDSSLTTNHPNPLGAEFRSEVLSRYFEANEAKAFRLIGKDGGVKSRSEKLNLEKIFALIDSMPMRQAEMRRD